ncbi:MAG: glycosyltransferase family 4 protein [Candidatus Geothermincolales bacterium]
MRVHQIVPRLDMGDAVSHQALSIHHLLQSWGFDSRIYATGVDDFGRRYAAPDADYAAFMGKKEDILIYHYLLYCGNVEMYLRSSNRKVLVYHNITPPEFYRGFHQPLYQACALGREMLAFLVDCELALGDSEYNRRELVEAGFPEEKTGVLPINPTTGRLDGVTEDRRLLEKLSDGRVNLLFVGRLVPHKKVDDVIRLFAAYCRGVNARSRLILVGNPITSYQVALASLCKKLAVEDRVVMTGKVSDGALKAFYLASRYYISMSEHEGFCVPILEAFHFGLPVLAYAAAAVPETMGGAGVLFDRKDFPLLAELLGRLDRDEVTRRRIVEAQRRRLLDFSEEVFEERLRRLLGPLLGLEVEMDEVLAGG